MLHDQKYYAASHERINLHPHFWYFRDRNAFPSTHPQPAPPQRIYCADPARDHGVLEPVVWCGRRSVNFRLIAE